MLIMVNTYKLGLTILQQEILRLLSIKSGMSFNQRGIARLLNVSAPAVMKALPELKKKAFIILEQDKESKRWSIELNRDNIEAIQMKRIENLRQIYESGIVEFLEDAFAGATIVLFGSYSRGEDTINSDIDIAIIGRKEKEINLAKFDKLLERTIFINFYDSFKSIHKNLRENILNGIVLSGSIEL